MSDTNTQNQNAAINQGVSDFAIVNGELHLVTTINDLTLCDHPQYNKFIEDAWEGEKTQALMTFSTPFDDLFYDQINSELDHMDGEVAVLSIEHKPKYDAIRQELVDAIALIDSLKFEVTA